MKAPRAFRLAPSPPWLVAPLIVMSLALLGSRSAFRPEPTVAKTVANRIESSPGHQATRIIIETGGRVRTQASGRLQNPERVYYDLLGAKLVGHRSGAESILVGDELLQRVRIARREGEITRVVLDLRKPAQVVASQIDHPDRFMIEVRPDLPAPFPSPVGTQQFRPIKTESAGAIPPKLQPQFPQSKHAVTSAMPREIASAPRPPTGPVAAQGATSMRVQTAKLTSTPDLAPDPVPVAFVPRPAGLLFQPFLRTRDSKQSLTRTLGLGVRRVILDPGHGGDDKGAVSRSGLKEKDLVLDVTQRLGKLIQTHLNSEVIYTRSEDSFVPLEARPALAKVKEADLFVSIHANWSPFRSAVGVETYYLNFTNKESWLEVAARENAGSGKSVHDLQSLIQEIAFSEKVSESRELAASVESSLYGSLSQNTAEEKDRGIKQAPFVVLIGSRVPSILVEIGFLSNPQEENLLQRADHRQRIADALYRGVAQYMNRLSHFDMAKTKATNPTPGLTIRPCPSGVLADSVCGERAPAGYSVEQIRETMEKASRSSPYFQPKSGGN